MAKVFFSYSHKDEPLRDELDVHLAQLKRQGLIETWHDRRIIAGDELDPAIDAYVEGADIILCLVSADFINSDYCYSREMDRAIERHKAGEARVIAVILRHCEWQETPLAQFLVTPKDGKPVAAWPNRDEAYLDVTREIRRAVEAMGDRVVPGPPRASREREALEALGQWDEVLRTTPRSANLHVPRVVTDKDRDDFVATSFEFIAEFFANSLDELKRRSPGVDGRFTRLDARRFVATLYREGKQVSAITVYTGGGFGGRGISFVSNDSGDTNSSNGSFQLPHRRDLLHFENIFGMGSGPQTERNAEAVAEEIWSSFIAPLQRER